VALGEELRGLVGADHVGEGDGRVLGPGRAVRREPEGADGRGIDDPPHTGLAGRLEDRARTVDVHAVQLGRIARPQPVVRGDVVERIGARHGARQRGAVEQVALHDLDGAAVEGPAVAAAARTTAAGTPRSRAHASTAADSMSTASAPVSIQRRAFCAADSTTAATVRSAPSPGTRGSGAVGQRVPSGPSTTVGTTRAPMASDGASAPQAPATTTRSGARHAGARSARRAPRSPMVASSSAPPMKWGADA